MQPPPVNIASIKPYQATQGTAASMRREKASLEDFGRILQRQEVHSKPRNNEKIKELAHDSEHNTARDAARNGIDQGARGVAEDFSRRDFPGENFPREHVENEVEKDVRGEVGEGDGSVESIPQRTNLERLEVDASAANKNPSIEQGEAIFAGISKTLGLQGVELDPAATAMMPFWVQYVQSTAPTNLIPVGEVVGNFEASATDPATEFEMLNILAPLVRAQAQLPPLNGPLIPGVTDGLTQPNISGLSIISGMSAKNDAATLDAVISAADKPLVDEIFSANDPIDSVVPPLFSNSLMSASKGATESAVATTIESDLLDTVTTGPVLDNSRDGATHTSKWQSQTDLVGIAASQAVDEKNKSFFQLRFNQQTLASDLAEKTGWIFEHKLDTAQIQLDPPELGPITVKIHTHQDQVSVTFVVNNPQAKEALDQSMQRLKDLLQEQGIMLAHSDVSGQRQQRENSTPEHNGDLAVSGANNEDEITLMMPALEEGVDHFV